MRTFKNGDLNDSEDATPPRLVVIAEAPVSTSLASDLKNTHYVLRSSRNKIEPPQLIVAKTAAATTTGTQSDKKQTATKVISDC